MNISGELVNNHIIIKKSSDIGRLFNRSHIGILKTPDTLILNLLEGVFLLDEGKMSVYHNKKQVSISNLLKFAMRNIPEFETKYLVFKDLRNRGYAISFSNTDIPVMFRRIKQQHDRISSFVVVAFSERDILDIDAMKQLLQQFKKKNSALWFALVDEEGDLTYYNISHIDLVGEIVEQRYPKGKGILLKNRLIVFDKKLANQLLDKEFFGKPFGEVLQLSFVEALYLFEKNILTIQNSDGEKLSKKKCVHLIRNLQPDIEQRLIVFKDLKDRGLLVKTGFKYGTHFRAYSKQPEKTHAEYLIHVVEKGFTSIWAEISRAVRLAHSVNKEFVFACLHGTTIDYITLGRLRP